MRDFKGIKRQRSRNRNGGGGGGGGGGGKPQHNANRAFDSNGPEGVKVRGAAQHVYEKYQQLARDAHTAGDRVLAENYLQHAEHYFRVMRAMQPQRPLSEIIGRDQFVSGYDIDFEDESGAGEPQEAESEADGAAAGAGAAEMVGDRQPRPEGRRDDYRPAEGRPRDDQPRQDRFQGDRGQNDRSQNDRNDRNDRSQADRGQGERYQGERPQNDRYQSERPQGERRDDRGSRNDRPRFNRDDPAPRSERPERFDRSDRDTLAVAEAEATPLAASAAAAPSAPLLRADDGEVSHAPAFLQVRPVEPRSDSGEEVRRPRRRRAPSTFVDAEEPSSPAGPAAEEG